MHIGLNSTTAGHADNASKQKGLIMHFSLVIWNTNTGEPKACCAIGGRKITKTVVLDFSHLWL
jgi:hypothetical protein